MSALDGLLLGCGIVAVVAALMAVLTSRVVHAALWLVLTLGAMAGCYLALGAELVALVQILVYVGAVVVLVLFALMLTRAPVGPDTAHRAGAARHALAGAVGAGTTLVLLVALWPLAGGDAGRRVTDTHQVALDLFGVWVWPFEALSFLLLTALVAALAVSRVGGGRR